MASLILLKTPDGSATGERVQLGNADLIIGRSPEDCQVVLPPNAVSRKHAQISFSQGSYFLEDLGSRNKTYLNNKEVNARTPLKDGDGIKICDFLFCFRDEHRAKQPRPRPKPPEEEEENSTTVEAALQGGSHQNFLDVQPADKLKAILRISSVLSKTLHLEKLIPQIADELLDLFRQADRCFIIDYDAQDDRLIPVVTKTRRSAGTNERFSRTIVRKCLESLQSYLSEDATADNAIAAAQSIAEFRIRSVMCVPLATQDNQPLGVIQLDSQDRTKKFTQDDLKLLICVADQASVAIENARMHEALVEQNKLEEENRAATRVQRGFLPQRFPEMRGYEFYSHYLAARTVGGDYYDFIPLPGGRQAVLLGDVAGKGVPAALLMARVCGEARVAMLTQPDLGTAITRLNDQLMQMGLEDRYLTLAASILDPVENRVTLVNAGHVVPAVYRQASRRFEKCVPENASGFPIGWVPGFVYNAVTVELGPGDSMILFTDGILDAEAPDGTRFGEEGVRKALAAPAAEVLSARVIGERIIRAVRAHAASQPQFDDIALVCYGRVDSASTVPGHSEIEIGSVPRGRPS
jgi:phosphoserine phosphatase RsbU/P